MWDMASCELTCSKCGDAFLAGRRDARYCSSRCREQGRVPRPQPTAEQRRAWREARLTRDGYRAETNAAANERIRAVKQWVAEYKLAQGCIDCGYNEHAVALDIDHVNGKTNDIHKLKSIGAVRAEIDRHSCVVRCANCHRVKSWETRTWDVSSPSTRS